jgi:D-arabinose 1-dehydrogenase-like Zn-dependent alcohol dehydrogenase
MVNIPKEHKAAVCEAAGKGLVVKMVPTPKPDDNQVLIKV